MNESAELQLPDGVEASIDLFPVDGKVLVIGSDRSSGKHLLPLLTAINKPREWIKTVFSDRASLSDLAGGTKLVIFHNQTAGRAIQAFRGEARRGGFSCITRPLNMNELKATLQVLSNKRNQLRENAKNNGDDASKIVTSSANVEANGVHHQNNGVTASGADNHLPDVLDTSPAPSESAVTSPVPVVVSDEDPILLIDAFRGMSDKVGIALLQVRDDAEVLRQKNVDLEEKVVSRERELREMGERLRVAEENLKTVSAERDELRQTQTQLDTTMRQFLSRKK